MCNSKDCIVINSQKPNNYVPFTKERTHKPQKAGCIVKHEDRYLFIQVVYAVWGFPKGSVENEETLEETAIRELKEEANINVSNLINPNKTFRSGRCTLFHVELKEKVNYDDFWNIDMGSEITGIAFVCKECMLNLGTFNSVTRDYFKKIHDINLEKNEKIAKIGNRFNNKKIFKACKYGLMCETNDCPYEHRICKFGNRCNRKETCFFVHVR